MDVEILEAIDKVLDLLRQNKGAERSERARRFAVTITEMEKVQAYFTLYVVSEANVKPSA